MVRAMNRIIAFATTCLVSACVTDELPAGASMGPEESTELQAVIEPTVAPMTCTFPGSFTSIDGANACRTREPTLATSRITFTVVSQLGAATRRSWKVTPTQGGLELRDEAIVRISGCTAFDTTCEIAFTPRCKVGPAVLSSRDFPRLFTATVTSTPLLGGLAEVATATATVDPVNCASQVIEPRMACLTPPPLPFLRVEDTMCRGVYYFKFAQIPGTGRYEGQTVQNGFDWSYARSEFNCASETIGQEASFKLTVGSLGRRFRFRACNECGCSPWGGETSMRRTEDCL